MPPFHIISNKIVLDERTNLQWTKDYATEKTWDQAHEYCNELNAQRYAGFDDWRLPIIEELRMLVDHSRFNPASLFPDMPSKNFWSSSSYASITDLAWFVNFAYGYVLNDYKTYGLAARCARGGPSVLDSSKKKKKKRFPPFSQSRLQRF